MKYILVPILLIVLSACTSVAPPPAADNYLAKGFSPPPQGSLVVLLPASKSADFPKSGEMVTSNRSPRYDGEERIMTRAVSYSGTSEGALPSPQCA